MKKLTLLMAAVCLAFAAGAQTFPAYRVMKVHKGKTVTHTISLMDIDSLSFEWVDDPTSTVFHYTESDEVFPNPERGIYVQQTIRASNPKTFSASWLRELREENITLTLNLYYLDKFYTSDISDSFLNIIRTNMQTLRENGAKTILRFGYTDDNSDNNKSKWDASQQWVFRHIDQLTPIFQEYADVIYCVQAGFIGVWGEWYYTSHFNMEPDTEAEFAPRKELINRLLAALPETREVSLRTPAFKVQYMGSSYTDTLTADIAHDGSPQARLGGHNDCFVSSSDDYGTYVGSSDRSFWAADTRFTIMGGETCSNKSYGKWENALPEMYKFHWSYMNRDYHGGLLDSWEAGGHMDDLRRLLGYRLVLDNMWYTTSEVKAGEAFTFYLTMRNIGFANIMNPRAVELILVNKANPSDKHVLPITDEDPRFWMAGETTQISLTATLPASCKGEYTLYLNLPDPEETLHDNPKFSIRLANEDMWEESTGYNKLGVITID